MPTHKLGPRPCSNPNCSNVVRWLRHGRCEPCWRYFKRWGVELRDEERWKRVKTR